MTVAVLIVYAAGIVSVLANGDNFYPAARVLVAATWPAVLITCAVVSIFDRAIDR